MSNMMAEEKINFLPLPTFRDAESERRCLTDGYTKSYPKKKCVLTSVSVIGTMVVAITIILTAFYAAMCLRETAPGSIVSFSYNPDPETTEDVTSDSSRNTVQFHVNSPNYEIWVEDNFNTDIRVMKVLAGSRFTCYATPLNRTTASDPSEFSAALHPAAIKQNYTYSMQYRAANTPIPDTSFLSKTSREMCREVSTYWVYPSCHSPEEPTRRNKRWKFSMSIKWWLSSISISFES